MTLVGVILVIVMATLDKVSIYQCFRPTLREKMKITEGKRQVRDKPILYKGQWGVILRARVGRNLTPIMAEIQFQFGDRRIHDISEAYWDTEKKLWVVK